LVDEAEVSLTLEACTCVLFTMFCTFTLISLHRARNFIDGEKLAGQFWRSRLMPRDL